MKKKMLTKMFAVACVAAAMGVGYKASAVPTERLIIYENFGGVSPSESGVSPAAWPAVHADSTENLRYTIVGSTTAGWRTIGSTSGLPRAGWSYRPERGATTNTDFPASYLSPQITAIAEGVKATVSLSDKYYNINFAFPQPHNDAFHVDSITKYRTGGWPSDVNKNDDAKTWRKPVTLLNGAKTFDNNSSVDFRMLGVASFPKFKFPLAYDPAVHPLWQGDGADQIGYLYLGKDVTVGTTANKPAITIPNDEMDYLKDVTKVELLIAGSRSGNNNNILLLIAQQYTEDGISTVADTFTYSVAYTPRLVSVPINAALVRLIIQSRGAGNNNTYTDFNTADDNTHINKTSGGGKYNAAPLTQSSNPGLHLLALKVYGTVESDGHRVTASSGLTVSPAANGIATNTNVTLTADAQKDGKNFVGWKISGRPDLSEVANPITITVTEDLTVAPVYVGDEVEVAVVNENFTSWEQHGKLATDAVQASYGKLLYSSNPNDAAQLTNEMFTGIVRVPLRYGFKAPDGKDSVDVNLYKVNVMPQNTVRMSDVPGADRWYGYVAFMGPNDNKGYVEVDSLGGISKAEVELSPYDNGVAPIRAAAVMVNGSFVRNKMLSTFYAEKVTVKDELPADGGVRLRVGYGNQALSEYLTTSNRVPDIAGNHIKGIVVAGTGSDATTALSAAAIALHSLKLYAKLPAPDITYQRLTVSDVEGGTVLVSPEAGNSTNDYPTGTVVTLTAMQATGYGFDGWDSGEGTAVISPNATLSVTMDAAKTIRPKFAQNPSYVTITVAGKGAITSTPEADVIVGNKYTFLAGVPVSLTATPDYGWKADRTQWLKEGVPVAGTQAGLNSGLTLTAAELVKEATLAIEFTFDSIIDRVIFTVKSDTLVGKATYDYEPEDATYDAGTTLSTGKFPLGATIAISNEPKYSWTVDTIYYIDRNGKHQGIPADLATKVMSKDTAIELTWKKLSYHRLEIINNDPNGEVAINDPNMHYGANEEANKYPMDYWVTLSIAANTGWMLIGLGDAASYQIVSDTEVQVWMGNTTDDSVIVVEPMFAEKQEGVRLMVEENFQNASRWPHNSGQTSNVPGAVAYLGLASDWSPIGKSTNEILTALAPYRALASEGGNTVSEGPGISGKTPATSQSDVFKAYEVKKIPAGGTDSVTITLGNFAPCNDCMIKKAVKKENIGMKNLGQVSPGIVTLQNMTNSSAKSGRSVPFLDGDTVGVMIIDGMAYVQNLVISFVPGTSNMCPTVYYNTIGDASVDENGRFHGDVSGWKQKGQLESKAQNYRPDQGKYGWGSAQEGMTMDQEMYIAEDGVEQTQVIIMVGSNGSAYCSISLHDLKIWGSPRQITETPPTGIADLFDKTSTKSPFYLLGNTGVLKVDVPEPVKTVVLYNEMGSCVGVYQSIGADNQLRPKTLKPGVYGAHAYTVDGKRYAGSFINVNN